jgi:hypothetical protein
MSCGLWGLAISLTISLDRTWIITRSPDCYVTWKVISSVVDIRGEGLMPITIIS